MGGREADLVVPRVCGAEGEAAAGGAALGDDPVVVVEHFFDGNEDFEVGVCGVAVYAGVVLLSFVVAWVDMVSSGRWREWVAGMKQTDYEGVFGKFLVETFRGHTVHVKVESIYTGEKAEETEE